MFRISNLEFMKVLLHICCAPCGGYVIEKLKEMGWDVTAFFYNPNVFPKEEYDLRLSEAKKLCEKYDVNLIEGEYDHGAWLEKIKGLEKEPEKGKRCEVDFTLRLSETAQVASENGFDAIAATLTVSPHKPAELINEIGHEMAAMYGVTFIDNIWRKGDGFKKSCEICDKEHFHRQNYCGCEFSVN